MREIINNTKQREAQLARWEVRDISLTCHKKRVSLTGDIKWDIEKATHNVPCTYLLCPGIKSNVEVRGKSLPLAILILALGSLQKGLYNVRIAFQTCHMEGIQTTLGGEKTCISSCDLGKRIARIVSCMKTP